MKAGDRRQMQKSEVLQELGERLLSEMVAVCRHEV